MTKITNGSDKQITWAEKIREKMITDFEEEIEELEEDIEYYETKPTDKTNAKIDKAGIDIDGYKKAIIRIKNCDSAHIFISAKGLWNMFFYWKFKRNLYKSCDLDFYFFTCRYIFNNGLF